jgi:hypothetical protein
MGFYTDQVLTVSGDQETMRKFYKLVLGAKSSFIMPPDYDIREQLPGKFRIAFDTKYEALDGLPKDIEARFPALRISFATFTPEYGCGGVELFGSGHDKDEASFEFDLGEGYDEEEAEAKEWFVKMAHYGYEQSGATGMNGMMAVFLNSAGGE